MLSSGNSVSTSISSLSSWTFSADTGRWDRTEVRLKEARGGIFNSKSFYDEVAGLDQPLLDRAIYVGALEARNSPGRDRGLFTTLPIKAGDLLLCEKAFACGYVDDDGKTFAHGGVRQRPSLTENLVQMIIQKLSKNSSLFHEVRSLHSGGYESREISHNPLIVDGKLVLDT